MLWLTDPALPLNVTFTLAIGAVAAAVNVIACCPPELTLNWAGEATTPAGTPLIVTLTEGAVPLTLSVNVPDEPGVSATSAGCTLIEKSWTLPPPPPLLEEPPPPQPVSNTHRRKTGTAAGTAKVDRTRLIIEVSAGRSCYKLLPCFLERAKVCIYSGC